MSRRCVNACLDLAQPKPALDKFTSTSVTAFPACKCSHLLASFMLIITSALIGSQGRNPVASLSLLGHRLPAVPLNCIVGGSNFDRVDSGSPIETCWFSSSWCCRIQREPELRHLPLAEDMATASESRPPHGHRCLERVSLMLRYRWRSDARVLAPYLPLLHRSMGSDLYLHVLALESAVLYQSRCHLSPHRLRRD